MLPEDVCATSHGMTSSELGQVIRADHDYIELLVKVKAEEPDDEEEQQLKQRQEGMMIPEVPIDIKEEVVDHDSIDSKNTIFDNLATLAEVSLASAGQLEDKGLKRKIDQARAKISKTILPITPEMSSKRTMQVPEYIECHSSLHL